MMYHVLVLGFTTPDGTADTQTMLGIGVAVVRRPYGTTYTRQSLDNVYLSVADKVGLHPDDDGFSVHPSMRTSDPLDLIDALTLADTVTAEYQPHGFDVPVVVFN